MVRNETRSEQNRTERLYTDVPTLSTKLDTFTKKPDRRLLEDYYSIVCDDTFLGEMDDFRESRDGVGSDNAQKQEQAVSGSVFDSDEMYEEGGEEKNSTELLLPPNDSLDLPQPTSPNSMFSKQI